MHSVNFDVNNQMVVKNAISPAAARAASTNGTAIDCARTGTGSQRVKSVTFLFTTGTLTDGTYTLSIEESDSSGSGYAAIPAARVKNDVGTIAATADDTAYGLSCMPAKRYVRLVVTAAGTTTGGIYSATALLHVD